MVAEYGMSEKLGPVSFGHEEPNPFFGGSKFSGATEQLIDEEVTRLLNEAHDQAERILNDHRELLDKLSALLLVVETIDGEDLGAYAAGTKQIPDPETVRPIPQPEPSDDQRRCPQSPRPLRAPCRSRRRRRCRPRTSGDPYSSEWSCSS